MISLNKLEGLETKVLQALKDISNLKSVNSILTTENKMLKEQLSSTREKLSVRDEELSRLKSELKSTGSQMSEINRNTDGIDGKIDTLHHRIDEFYDSNNEKNEKSKPVSVEEMSIDLTEDTERPGDKRISDDFSDDDFGDIIIID